MKILFGVLGLLLINAAAFAATPIVSSVSGTVATGQTLTITGANMIQEATTNWQSAFQSGTTYGFEGSSYSADGWALPGDINSYAPVYDSSVKLSGNKSVKFRIAGARAAGPGGLTSYLYRASSSQDIWIRGYVKLSAANNLWAISHSKMIDWQGSGAQYYFQPGAGSSLPVQMTMVYDGANHTGSGRIASDDNWHLFELHWKSSSPRTYTTYWDNVLIGNATPTNAGSMSYILLGFINAAGTSSGFDATYWFDNFAVSSSRIYPSSVIEISGDGTNWKYQYPVSLGDTSSQIKVDLSGLTGTNYRLRVTNNQQQTSAIYTLSGGGGGGGADIQPPTVPSNLTASAVSSSGINLSWTASTDNTGVTGYRIYRNGTYLATTTTTSYANTGLSASTSYSYKVSAVDAAGNESGQSITATATTQSSGIGGGTGGTTLLQESFDNNSFASRGWYDNTAHGSVVTGGQSGSSMQWSWAQGAATPNNGGSMRRKITPTDSLYMSFYVKFQTGWRGSQRTYHPHMFLIPSDLDTDYAPLANNYLNTYVEFVSDVGGSYAIRPVMAIQDEKRVNTSYGTPPNNLTALTENRSVAYCNTPVPAGVTGTCYADNPYYSANLWKGSSSSVSTNVWHKVEVYLKMNTISGGKGLANGIMQQWLDGVQVINRNDVLYRTAQDATKKWAQVVMAPWIGDGSPIAQTMWLDELTVATAPPSSSGGDAQAPTVPAGVIASSVSASQINLNWTAATDNTAVTGYKIYRNGTYLATAATTSFTNTGLTASTAYSYRVSAIDAAGNESAQSTAATATTQAAPDTAAPSVPAGLSASTSSATQINLSWTASTDNVGVAGYKIYRGGTLLTSTTGTSYVNTGLTASTSYTYRVSAVDAAGNESTQSTAATATTRAAPDTTAPSVPAGLSALANSATQITLSWTASTDNVGVTGYKIYRGGTPLTSTTGTSYVNTGLTASTAYTYRVSAIDAAGNESTQSAAATVTTQAAADTTAPSVPAGLAASATSSTQINLSWTAATDNVGVTGYKIYRGGTSVATSRTTSYTDSGLTASTAYTYRVSAIDTAGNESGQSVAASATTHPGVVIDTTAPSVPSGLTASATSATQVNLSWTASTDNVKVTGYKVYRGGVVVATATTTTHADSGLTASTAYSYKVTAIDAAGNESAQSAAASATTPAASAATILLQESFDNSSFATRGWYDTTTHGTIVVGGQSGNSLQWAWTQGAAQPTNGGAMRKKFTPTDSLYVSFYVKFQTGWRGSQKSYDPRMIFIPSDMDGDWTALGSNYLNTYIDFLSDIGSSYAIRPQLAIQDGKRVNSTSGTLPNNLAAVTESRSVAYCNTPLPAGATGTCVGTNPYSSMIAWKASNASVSANVWHKVDVYLKMNTVSSGKGQADGVMQQWVDGVQVMDRKDVLYRTAQDATKKWAQFVLAPWIGDGSPIAQTMWLDELTVSTAPPRVPLKAPVGFKIATN